jgi:hypothetical protein
MTTGRQHPLPIDDGPTMRSSIDPFVRAAPPPMFTDEIVDLGEDLVEEVAPEGFLLAPGQPVEPTARRPSAIPGETKRHRRPTLRSPIPAQLAQSMAAMGAGTGQRALPVEGAIPGRSIHDDVTVPVVGAGPEPAHPVLERHDADPLAGTVIA